MNTRAERAKHGTIGMYANHACRCDPCTWAWASYGRGDRPYEPVPRWFDDWVRSAASL